MSKKKHFDYEPYVRSLAEFMSKRIKLRPFPKIRLSNRNQGEGNVFIKTGWYDPESREVMLLINQRHPKDVLRSLAHEFVHHYQNLEGRLSYGAYSGQEIINDEKLMELEKEAYLKGNILFRSWTESIQNKIESEPTEHMRKKIKLDK